MRKFLFEIECEFLVKSSWTKEKNNSVRDFALLYYNSFDVFCFRYTTALFLSLFAFSNVKVK